jgi:cytochrome c oxidase subunit III
MSDDRSFLAHHFDDLGQQREAQSLGMWIFLATEVLVFGAMFTGYTVYRSVYPDDFAAASARLNLPIGAVNTLVLLTSSLTMVLAVYAARTDRRRALVWLLLTTAALGTLFMAFKAVEYYVDYRENLVPRLAFNPEEWKTREAARHVQLFLMFYYIMTGLHAVHLTVGIVVLLIMAALAWRGRFPPANYMPVDIAGLYWHFVDIIWIFLLPLLYLIGTREWAEVKHQVEQIFF